MSTAKKIKNPKKKIEKDEQTALATTIKAEMARVREAFAAGPLFQEAPDQQDPPVAVAAWAVLDALKDVIEDRKEAYRQHLLKYAEKNGEPVLKKGKPTGGQELTVDSSRVIREHRQDKLPQDCADFRLMLAAKNIAIPDVYDEVKVLQLNPSKLEFLLDSGKLSAEEVDEFRRISWALKIKQSEIIEEFLEEMVSHLLGDVPNNRKLKSV